MRKNAAFLALLCIYFPAMLMGFQKLDSKYLITYGDPEASAKVVEYFSFSCPNCVSLFKDEFSRIKRGYVDTDRIYLVFHPIPMDLLTVQAMACLEYLSEAEKRVFLEEIMDEASQGNPGIVPLLMEKVMEVAKKPVSNLRDMDSLEVTPAFQSAFEFVRQGVVVDGVPSMEVNGVLQEGELPTAEAIERALQTYLAGGVRQ